MGIHIETWFIISILYTYRTLLLPAAGTPILVSFSLRYLGLLVISGLLGIVQLISL